jgi:molybdate/tungstate transport system permease protein
MSVGNRSDGPKALRRGVVLALLAVHVAGHVVLSLRGSLQPFEPFSLLLLGANGVIAVVLLRGAGDLLLGAGTMLLILAHALLGQHLAPDSLTSGAMLMVSIIVLYVGVKVNRHLPARYWYAFVAGYFVLFVTFIVLLDNAEALFLLFLLGLAACSRSLRLLAYFWALTISFTFCQPFAWEAAIISFFILTALFGARGNVPSPTAIVFLGVGLVLVMLVLLPVVVVLLGEDPRNIVNVLGDPRVRSAIWTTAVTATISTAFLCVVAVPTAYAVSRLRFPGRSLLLSLIDVPIVIPQSVAGIALLKVFSKQQFLGEALFYAFGIRFDGTILGICLAQVFVAMPFITRSAVAAFEAVPEGLEFAARTLGASSWGAFRRVALPLASQGVFLGAVLAWARAAGEFGALVFIAPTPETAPVAAYNRFNSVGMVETVPLVAALLLFSLAMFFLLQLVSRTLPSQHGRGGGPR